MKGRQIPKDLLTRGVVDLVDPDKAFRNKLETNPQDVVIKFGVDPTRPDIHLGHAVILKKLKQFQDLGCKVIFLVGDYTAQIGDPTGKDKTRPEISFDEIEKNKKSFLDQVGKILDINGSCFDWIGNQDWYFTPIDYHFEDGRVTKIKTTDCITNKTVEFSVLSNTFIGKGFEFQNKVRQNKNHQGGIPITSITLNNVIEALRQITVSQLLERDMFKKRLKSGKEIYLHELMYPVLQGIDSIAIDRIYESCDLEMGGTDQTFNMMVGRTLMRKDPKIKEPQAIMTMDILEGIDGKEKMSKSLNNYISISDEPRQMYGKVMSIPDHLIVKYFALCTDISMDDTRKIERSLKDKKTNPKDVKMRLAREIVKIYHPGKEDEAEQAFTSTFSKKEIPADAKKVKVKIGAPLVDILIKNGFVASKSEFRRLVEEGAITFKGHIEEKKIIDPASLVSEPGALKIGKRRFLHIDITKNK